MKVADEIERTKLLLQDALTSYKPHQLENRYYINICDSLLPSRWLSSDLCFSEIVLICQVFFIFYACWTDSCIRIH